MVSKLHFLLLLAVVLAAVAIHPPSEDRKAFEKFKIDFNKVYASKAEEEKRFKIFVASSAEVRKLNEEHKGSTTFGINQFSDESADEFLGKHTGGLGR